MTDRRETPLATAVSPSEKQTAPGVLGTGQQQVSNRHRPSTTLVHALAFVAGFTTVFVAFGASATIIGQGFLAHKVLLMRISGAVIIVLGLNMVGVFRIPWLWRDVRLQLRRPQASYPASYIAGIGFAAGWTPCIGPVLAAVLAMAGAASSIVSGIGLLFV